MGLMKPPNLITFALAVVLGIIGTLSHLGLQMPVIGAFDFWLLFAGFALLVGGCLFRGM